MQYNEVQSSVNMSGRSFNRLECIDQCNIPANGRYRCTVATWIESSVWQLFSAGDVCVKHKYATVSRTPDRPGVVKIVGRVVRRMHCVHGVCRCAWHLCCLCDLQWPKGQNALQYCCKVSYLPRPTYLPRPGHLDVLRQLPWYSLNTCSSCSKGLRNGTMSFQSGCVLFMQVDRHTRDSIWPPRTQMVNISSDAAMTSIPAITLLEVTRLLWSYFRAVGTSSMMLM